MYKNVFGLEAVSSRAGRIAAVLVVGLLIMTDSVVAQVAASATVNQRSAVVDGRVTDTKGAPLTDVLVRLDGTPRGSVSDEAGRFRIAGVPGGEYTLVAQRVGLETVRRPLPVRADSNVSLSLVMREAIAIQPPMVISATRELRRRAEGSATVDVMDGAEVRRTRAAHPSGIMNRIAGVHVSEMSGEGHSMAMRQPITTKPMYLYLEDGIPTRPTGFFNHNALYEVNIPQSGGLEVIKGPGTALFGSDAIGGVVNVLTRPAPLAPAIEGSLEGGAYGYRRAMVSGGSTRGGNGLRADVNVTHSDNWKDLAPFDRTSATLRWDAVFGASGWTARSVITGSMIDQQDVPAIPLATFDTANDVNLAPIAYRRARALRLSTAIERDAGKSLWSLTPFARVNRMDLLPSWQLTFDPQTWDTRNTSTGVLARYRRDFAPMTTRVIVGADADLSPGHFVARQAVVSRAAPWTSYADGELHYDYDVTYRQLSPYLHLETTPLPRLRVDLGLRADWTGYRYATALAPLDTGVHRRPADTTVSYAHLSPKIGVSFEVARGAALFASYRHGFRAPSQGQLFQQNAAANTVGLRPVTVDSWEAGLRGDLGSRAIYQLSAYDMTINDDILTYRNPQNRNEAMNAGRTRHRGIEASAGIAVTSGVRVDASWSVSKQQYVTWAPSSTVNYAGNTIEAAPRDLGNIMITWSPSVLRDGRLALEWSHTGRYALDAANTDTYGGYELLTLHANAMLTPRAELFVRVVNLADRKYAEVVTFDAFQRDQYTPAAPRTLFAGIRIGAR
jgi:iron complex outermembrane recepter protein